MRLRTWLDSLARRHASTRMPKKRRSHGPKATTRKTHAAYQSLASETLEPRQLLTATSGMPDLENVDFTQTVQLTDPSSESDGNSTDTSGSLSGFKWHDANGNGAWDSGEAGLADWTIYIDANENGALDLGEASTTTATDGSYRFEGLAPGNYTIGEVQQEGWQQTYPDSLGNAAGSSVDTSNLSTPEILVGAAYTDGELIVKLRDAASAPGVLSDLRTLQKTVGGTTLRAAEDLGFELWSIEGDVKDAIAQWGDNPSFQYIQPNYTITVDATVPNDTEFDRLWGLHNTGQTGGSSDADIDAVEAWDLQTGGNVVVGRDRYGASITRIPIWPRISGPTPVKSQAIILTTMATAISMISTVMTSPTAMAIRWTCIPTVRTWQAPSLRQATTRREWWESTGTPS